MTQPTNQPADAPRSLSEANVQAELLRAGATLLIFAAAALERPCPNEEGDGDARH